MILKDKEILAAVKMLNTKVDMLINMFKADKIKKASKEAKKHDV